MKAIAKGLARRRLVCFNQAAQQDTPEDIALRARGCLVWRIGTLSIVIDLSAADEPKAS